MTTRTDILRLRLEQRGDRQVRGALAGVGRETDRVSRGFTGLGTAARAALAAVVAGFSIGAVVRASDTYAQLQGRLRLVTDTAKELARVEGELFESAQRTRGAYEGTVELYARLARSTEALGASTEDLLAVTETINQAIVVSGSSSASASAALFQLGQGFASGTLRGEELNSVLEQTPRLARAIAEGMGVTVGELRKLGEEGKLTAAEVFAALQSQADTIEREFGQMERTVGQAMTQLRNDLQRAAAAGDLSPLVDAIDDIREIVSDPSFIENLGATISGLASLTERVVAFSAALGHLPAAAGLTEVDDDFVRLDNQIREVDDRITELRSRLDSRHEGLARFLPDAFFVDEEEINRRIEALTRERERLLAERERVIESRSPEAAESGDGERPSSKKSGGPSQDLIDRADEIRREIDPMIERNEALREFNKLHEAGLLSDEELLRARDMAQAEFDRAAGLDAAAKASEKFVKVREDLLSDIQTATREAEVGLIRDAREAALRRVEIAAQEFRDRIDFAEVHGEERMRLERELSEFIAAQTRLAIEETRSPMERLADEWEDTTERMREATAGWLSGAADGLTEFVTTGKLRFRDFAESVIEDLVRIQIQQALAGLLSDIQLFSPTASTTFVPAAASGGVVGPEGVMPLQRYRHGGIAREPQLAVFGEGDTPEAFVPLPDGRAIPVRMQGGGGNTFVVDARGADASVERRVMAALNRLAGPGVVERRAVTAVAEQKQRGGRFAAALE